MKRGTQIRRKLLVSAPHGETRRGNPKGFWFFLECGHINYEYFTTHHMMNVFMLKVGQSPDVRCRKCSRGKMEIPDLDIEIASSWFPADIYFLQQKIKKYRDSLKSLLESAPIEFGQQFEDVPAYKYRHLKVVKEYQSTGDGWEEFKDNPWPGSHKHVYVWWKLEDGHAVGFNENPSRGWSFPVTKLKEETK